MAITGQNTKASSSQHNPSGYTARRPETQTTWEVDIVKAAEIKPQVPDDRPPTEAELYSSLQYVNLLKEEFTYRVSRMIQVTLSPEEQQSYRDVLHCVWFYLRMVDPHLNLFACAYSSNYMETTIATVRHNIL